MDSVLFWQGTVCSIVGLLPMWLVLSGGEMASELIVRRRERALAQKMGLHVRDLLEKYYVLLKVGRSVSQSISQSVSQSVSQSISQSVSQSVNQSVNQSVRGE